MFQQFMGAIIEINSVGKLLPEHQFGSSRDSDSEGPSLFTGAI